MRRRTAAVVAAVGLTVVVGVAGVLARTGAATAVVPVAARTATLPKVTWLPAGYTLQIHRDTAAGPLDVYRQMSERDRIEKLHGAPIGSVAISPAPTSDKFLKLPHETVRSGNREYLVFTELGKQIAVVWRAGGVQVVTSHLSLAQTTKVVDGLVAS